MTTPTTQGTRSFTSNGVKVIVSASAAALIAKIKSARIRAAGTGGPRGRSAPWREVFDSLRPMDQCVVPYSAKDAEEKAIHNGHEMPTFGGIKSGAAAYFKRTGRNIAAFDMGDGTATLIRVDDGSTETGNADDGDDTVDENADTLVGAGSGN